MPVANKLSVPQQRFLEARKVYETDLEAAESAGVSRRSVARWKKTPAFMQVYRKLVRVVEVIQNPEPVIPEDAPRNEAYEDVLNELRRARKKLPGAFDRLFEIVESPDDKVAIQAIKVVGDWFGISPELLKPDKLTDVQKKILEWTEEVRITRVEPNDNPEGGEEPEALCTVSIQ